MGLSSLLRSQPLPPSFQPRVEELEPRIVPYATTGNVWPHPQLITISFVPDGTNLGGVSSNLFATLDAKFGSATAWQTQILKAAQTWAQQTNINFSVIADSGAASGSGPDQQGDPTMGDIRIGGYNFNNSGTLAAADFSPSANNYSVGGDITFNTGVAWNIGSAYDLSTVAMHEIGHALGLGHSSTTSAVMYSAYSGTKTALSSDDIAGIRSIYSGGSARSGDAYDNAASNGTFAAASDITSLISPTALTAVVKNLDITTTADLDYYKFTVPANAASTVTVTVQSSGLSLLSPKLYVYNAAETQLATVSGAGQYGTTLTTTISGVTPGSVYYIKVMGADTTAFSTGAYALTVNASGSASAAPSVLLPSTTTPNGSPLHSGGGLADQTLLGLLLGGLEGLLHLGIFGGYGDLLSLTPDEGGPPPLQSPMTILADPADFSPILLLQPFQASTSPGQLPGAIISSPFTAPTAPSLPSLSATSGAKPAPKDTLGGASSDILAAPSESRE